MNAKAYKLSLFLILSSMLLSASVVASEDWLLGTEFPLSITEPGHNPYFPPPYQLGLANNFSLILQVRGRAPDSVKLWISDTKNNMSKKLFDNGLIVDNEKRSGSLVLLVEGIESSENTNKSIFLKLSASYSVEADDIWSCSNKKIVKRTDGLVLLYGWVDMCLDEFIKITKRAKTPNQSLNSMPKGGAS